MLDIRNSFADMYDIKFNAKKSLGIKFGGQPVMSENLYLGKSRIDEWVLKKFGAMHFINPINRLTTTKVYSTYLG